MANTPSATLNPPPVQHRLMGSVANEGGKETYSACVTGLVPVASATDIFTIIGSATKTVKINKICISGTAGVALAADIQIVKRSTAGSGGTATTRDAVPYDSNSAAATAVVKAFTANPTVGTAVGVVAVASVGVTAATGNPQVLQLTFGDRNGKPLTLNLVTEQIAINLNGVSITAGALDIFVEWTEE